MTNCPVEYANTLMTSLGWKPAFAIASKRFDEIAAGPDRHLYMGDMRKLRAFWQNVHGYLKRREPVKS